ADALDAYLRGLTKHEPRKILEFHLLRTHNDSERHWRGDHGRPLVEVNPELLGPAIKEASMWNEGYIDSHAWRFTPSSFSHLTESIFGLGLTSLKPIRVYNSVYGRNEFAAILQKQVPDA